MTTQPPPRDSGMTGHAQSLVLPHDEYNQQLVANVHPSDWVNPEPTGRYNIVVIGACEKRFLLKRREKDFYY